MNVFLLPRNDRKQKFCPIPNFNKRTMHEDLFKKGKQRLPKSFDKILISK